MISIPDHQLGVNRGAPDRAVERGKIAADAGEVDKAVDDTDQMVGRDMILEAELVEQAPLQQPPFTHHRVALHCPGRANQRRDLLSSPLFQLEQVRA
jgi:hypothetical protein